jgi:hypothetical protein
MIKVKHSGHLGDVIYSLAAIKAAATNWQEKITYYLHQDVPLLTINDAGFARPAITKQYAEFIKPLLEAQPYVEECVIFTGASFTVPVDMNLDRFRHLPVNFDLGHLPLHYMHLCGHFFDYAKPWLTIREEDKKSFFKNKIVLGRSTRNIDPNIDYSVLKNLKEDLVFLGSDDEFEIMKRALPRLEHVKVSTAYELACVIASCKLYIGNSSFNFAVAEGLKKNRLFEMNTKLQSLMPCGNVDYFINTQQLLQKISALN